MIAALVVILVVAGSWRFTAPPARSVLPALAPSHAATSRTIATPALAITIGLAAAALLLGGVPGLALLGAIVIGRRWQRVGRERRARRRVEALFPDVVDLFVVAVRAGLLPAMAMQQGRYLVAEELRPPIAAVCDHLDDGATFAEALTTLVTTVGTTARPFVDAVVAAERYGLPLAPVLDRLTVEAREQRRRDGQAAARELPIRLAAPLVLCTLPSFALLAIAPLLLGALSSLHL
jgi:tight adherence protein C